MNMPATCMFQKSKNNNNKTNLFEHEKNHTLYEIYLCDIINVESIHKFDFGDFPI